VNTLRNEELAVQFWSIGDLLTACSDVPILTGWATRMRARYLRAD
jgi:hypothetical protein